MSGVECLQDQKKAFEHYEQAANLGNSTGNNYFFLIGKRNIYYIK